jgi:hypothetical protein
LTPRFILKKENIDSEPQRIKTDPKEAARAGSSNIKGCKGRFVLAGIPDDARVQVAVPEQSKLGAAGLPVSRSLHMCWIGLIFQGDAT